MSSDSEDEYGPALPPGFPGSKKRNSSTSEEEDMYGPALPSKPPSKPEPSKGALGPRLPSQDSSDSDSDSSSGRSEREISRSKRQKTIGPSIPEHLLKLATKSHDTIEEDSKYIGPVLPSHLKHLATASVSAEKDSDGSESDDEMIGPSVGLKATGGEQTSAAEFEMRAQKMHAKLTGQAEDDDTKVPTARESWMTELPSSKGNQLGLANRTFRKNEAPEMDSSWTDTPQERERKKKEKSVSGSKRKKKSDHYVPTEKDRKMESEIEQYNKSHRPDSLLAMHEKKLKKKKKKEKKKKKKDKKQEERRPFDRDLDLQVNKLDEAQRKSIIKRSQELNSRFKTGGMGTSFL